MQIISWFSQGFGGHTAPSLSFEFAPGWEATEAVGCGYLFVIFSVSNCEQNPIGGVSILH